MKLPYNTATSGVSPEAGVITSFNPLKLTFPNIISKIGIIDFHLLGGKFYPKNRFYYALNEAELLEQISFDIAFIGAASVSDGLVSFEDEADAHLKKLALKHAKTKILLAEQDKWQKESKYILGPVSDFDYWITDQEPSPEVQKLLGDKVKIIY